VAELLLLRQPQDLMAATQACHSIILSTLDEEVDHGIAPVPKETSRTAPAHHGRISTY
jgi:hypothetical protein